MEVYQITAGVAAGVIVAGVFGWCVYRIAAKERYGAEPEWTHVAGVALILILCLGGLLSG